MLSRRFLRVKALKALYAHKCSDDDSVSVAQKKMFFGITKSYELYHMMMQLIVDVADYGAMMVEAGRNKHLATDADINPNTRFVDNKLVAKIRACEPLHDFLTKNSLSWNKDGVLVRSMYEALVASDYYKKYMEAPVNNFDADKKLIVEFLSREVEDNELLHNEIEDMSIFWNDDIEFLTSRLMNSLNFAREKDKLKIPPLFKNDDDKEYVKDLFAQSIIHYDDNGEIIRKYAKNWDLERITTMDRLLIVMSIVEFTSFANIPTKVTLDEYLELAKAFSTQNSSVFINGILDRYAKDNEIIK